MTPWQHGYQAGVMGIRDNPHHAFTLSHVTFATANHIGFEVHLAMCEKLHIETTEDTNEGHARPQHHGGR